MTLREAAAYQIKQLKGKPLRAKISHILTYYWVPIVVFLAVALLVTSLTIHYASQKEPALTMCCINSVADENEVQTYLNTFATDRGVDLDKYEISVRTDLTMNESEPELSYQNAQLLFGMMAAQSLDIISAEQETILRYSYQETFVDLSQVITPERLDALEPYLIYMDRGYLPEMGIVSDKPRQYPDPWDPDSMAEPVPVAIMLPAEWESSKILSPIVPGEVAIGLVAGSKNSANAVLFMNYILEQEGI